MSSCVTILPPGAEQKCHSHRAKENAGLWLAVWKQEMALPKTSRLKDRLSTLHGAHCDAHSGTSEEAAELFQHHKLLSSQYSVKLSSRGVDST